MRPLSSTALVSSLLIALTASLSLFVVAAPLRAAPSPRPPADLPDCPPEWSVGARSSVHPTALLVGESARVTIQVSSTYTQRPEPLHIVFAVDASQHLDEREIREVRAVLLELVRHLDLPNDPDTRVALVDGAGGGRTLLPLVNDSARVIQRIGRLEAGDDGPRLPEVLREAHRVLRQGRRLQYCQQQLVNEIVVLVSPGADRRDCIDALRAARGLKSEGILLVTADANERPRDKGCLHELASSARYAYHIRELGRLILVFVHIQTNVTLRQMTVVETLAEGVEYVPRSARPDLTTIDLATGTLTWTLSFVPKVHELGYEVRLSRVGLQPLSEGARITWLDNRNKGNSLELEPAWAQVFGPEPGP